jgi:hypothetical protein
LSAARAAYTQATAMDIDTGNAAIVAGTEFDVEKAERFEKTPVAEEKLGNEVQLDSAGSTGLPFSKARLIGLVLCLSLAAFLNVRTITAFQFTFAYLLLPLPVSTLLSTSHVFRSKKRRN